MKKYYLLLSCLIAQTHASEVIQHSTLPNILVVQEWDKKPKNNALIAWDLNGVVFQADTSFANITRQFNEVRNQYGITYTLWAYSQYFWIWREKTRLKAAGDPAGFVWDAMFDLQEPQLAQVLRNSARASNSLNPQVAELLLSLLKNGHTNGVLSNMGTKLLGPLIEKLETREQNEAISSTIGFLKDPRGVVSSPENNWLHKPQPEIYRLFLSNFKAPLSQLRIFIDDKISNCIAALENGFDCAIICNNPSTLPRTFQQLGLL